MGGPKTPGQVNYEGYCARTGGVSLASGDTLPAWDDLAADIREAWEAAAGHVLAEQNSQHGDAGVEYR